MQFTDWDIEIICAALKRYQFWLENMIDAQSVHNRYVPSGFQTDITELESKSVYIDRLIQLFMTYRSQKK